MGKKLEYNVSTGSESYPGSWTGTISTQPMDGITALDQLLDMSVNDAEVLKPSHYDNSNGSLYKFCEDKGLNSYEFDIIKRVIRCRKKGSFVEDLEKTKFLIDLYLKEFKNEE